VLSRENRLTEHLPFTRTVRRGSRAGTASLVVHLYVDADAPAVAGRPPRVGLVVSKAVGNAVTRNAVKRRLRHLLRERLSSLPASGMLVVRALPPAGAATASALGGDLDDALARAGRRVGPRGVR
jgi:ribonuclease P protein component